MKNILSAENAQAAITIIDVCASRGAFKGEELVAVGLTRSRLSEHIESLSNDPELVDVSDNGTDEANQEG